MNYLNYLPEFLRDIADFHHLGTGIQPELSALREKTRNSSMEYCAQTASDEGIARYEKLFHVKPQPQESLEQRRFRILGHLRNCPPFSMNWLLDRLHSDFDSDYCSAVQFPDQSLLRISISASMQRLAPMLYQELRSNIPAAVELKMNLIHKTTTNLSFGLLLQTGSRLIWKENSFGTI